MSELVVGLERIEDRRRHVTELFVKLHHSLVVEPVPRPQSRDVRILVSLCDLLDILV